jgi:hypothetical protein
MYNVYVLLLKILSFLGFIKGREQSKHLRMCTFSFLYLFYAHIHTSQLPVASHSEADPQYPQPGRTMIGL